MQGMNSYTQAAMERAMKVQEVMLQAMAKKISWWQAAEILGISDRHMRRWRERYEEFGFRGLFDRRRGKPSPKRVPGATVERVRELYRERDFDLNVQHFHEKLRAEHELRLSYSWVKGILQGAGMVARGRKRGTHRKRRLRRPLPGMLWHIDGSPHRWLGDERWHDLIVILDDATSEIYYAKLVEDERRGLFCALYSDRGSHFWLTPKAGQKVDQARATQVGRALRELGVRLIPAYSPQARGRSERNFGTGQGRLPPELRLRAIRTVEAANAFLQEEYIAAFNAQFRVQATQAGSAFTVCRQRDLAGIFSLQFERTVNRDNTLSFQNLSLQIQPVRWRATLAGCTVTLHQHLDGTLSLRYGPHCVGSYNAEGLPWIGSDRQKAVEKPRRRRVINTQPDNSLTTKTGPFNLLRTQKIYPKQSCEDHSREGTSTRR